MFLILLIVTITLAYVALISYYLWHWRLVDTLQLNVEVSDLPFVSIIIIGRNESKNIKSCIGSILNNNYPVEKFEIIYVDDHSEDDSLDELRALKNENLSIFELKDYKNLVHNNTYKKQAIIYAFQNTKGEVILHTDADSVVGEQWILSHAKSYLEGAFFSAAPLLYKKGQGFLSGFQYLDILTTAGVTGAGIQSKFHYLSNGANMSYPAKIRKKMDLKRGSQFASGDDIFLIHEIAAISKDKIRYVANEKAIVLTDGEKSWKDFFIQRFRWAGKSSAYSDRKLQFVEILVFVMNASLLALFVMTLFNYSLRLLLLFQFLAKLMIDMMFIRAVSRKLNAKTDGNYLFLSFLFYPIYYMVIGLSAIFPFQTSWKGRIIK